MQYAKLLVMLLCLDRVCFSALYASAIYLSSRWVSLAIACSQNIWYMAVTRAYVSAEVWQSQR